MHPSRLPRPHLAGVVVSEEQAELPGLEAPARRLSGLEAGVERTLAQLAADGHIDPERDAARIELARELAAIIALKRSSGRASTVGADAKVLLELLDGMVPAEAATSADIALTKAMQAWSEAMAENGKGAA